MLFIKSNRNDFPNEIQRNRINERVMNIFIGFSFHIRKIKYEEKEKKRTKKWTLE